LDTYIFYGIAVIALLISFRKDKRKTRGALKKAWKAFENILPQLLTMVLLVGTLLVFADTALISRVMGTDSGWLGVLLAALIGSVTMIPPFVAFPTAAMLLGSGAGYMQIGAFVSTLTMVGVVTMPVEIQYFGKRLTFLRNLLAFAFSFAVAWVLREAVG